MSRAVEVKTLRLLRILLIVIGVCSSASGMRAPDVAPVLPDGWCDSKYGTPTRTTGECICKPFAICEGPHCVNEQGFIFYSGERCPTCQCVEGKRAPQKIPSRPPPVDSRQTANSGKQDLDGGSDEEDSFLHDWIVDELPRILIAGSVLIAALASVATILKNMASTAVAAKDMSKEVKASDGLKGKKKE